jgi:hypothetical protein
MPLSPIAPGSIVVMIPRSEMTAIFSSAFDPPTTIDSSKRGGSSVRREWPLILPRAAKNKKRVHNKAEKKQRD